MTGPVGEPPEPLFAAAAEGEGRSGRERFLATSEFDPEQFTPLWPATGRSWPASPQRRLAPAWTGSSTISWPSRGAGAYLSAVNGGQPRFETDEAGRVIVGPGCDLARDGH